MSNCVAARISGLIARPWIYRRTGGGITFAIEHALEDRQRQGEDDEKHRAVDRAIPLESDCERSSQRKDPDAEGESGGKPVEGFGRRQPRWRGLDVDDVEWGEYCQGGEDSPAEPKWRVELFFEDAVEGDITGHDVGRYVAQQFLKVSIGVAAVGRWVLRKPVARSRITFCGGGFRHGLLTWFVA